MSNYIPPFPTLQTGALTVERLNYKFDFFDPESQQWEKLQYTSHNGLVSFESQIWRADTFNLKITVDLELSGTKTLFDGSNAIVNSDDQIGVAVRWQIAGMHCRQYTVFENCVLKQDEDRATDCIECTFPPHFLRRQLNWEIILFLKEKKHHSSKENKHHSSSVYAADPGSLLGIIDQKILRTAGEFGEFITKWENKGKDAPLWRFELNFEDLEDNFDPDSVTLYLNSDHCASNLIYLDGNSVSPMLYEIFANVCFVLLKKAANEDTFSIEENVRVITTYEDYLNVMLKRLFPKWGKKDLQINDQSLMQKIRESLLKQGLTVSNNPPKEGN